MEQFPYIVTGATGAVGGAAVERLVKLDYPVLMACRNLEKAEKVRAKVMKKYPEARIDIALLDMSTLQGVADFVDILKANSIHPSGLLNNAGMMARYYGRTRDGIEQDIAVNYLATFLLTRMVLPLMRPGGTIVNTVSISRAFTELDRKFFEVNSGNFSQLMTYAKSKIALYLFTVELSKRVGENGDGPSFPEKDASSKGKKDRPHFRTAADCADRIRVNATDPGVVNSDMVVMHRWFDPLAKIFWRPFFTKSPWRGALPAVNALTEGRTGHYYHGRWRHPFRGKYANHPCAQWLWYATEAKLLSMGFKL